MLKVLQEQGQKGNAICNAAWCKFSMFPRFLLRRGDQVTHHSMPLRHYFITQFLANSHSLLRRGDQVTQRLVQRARSGAPSPRKPVMPDDPLLRAHSSVRKGAKDGFVNL